MTAGPEPQTKPVVDFDHHSPTYRADWPEIFSEMRSKCPLAWTESHGGYWVASRYDTVAHVARNADMFTSHKDLPLGSGPLKGPLIPDHNPVRQGFVEIDGPRHLAIRQPLMPFFSPPAAEQLRPEILEYTTWCIDQFIEDGQADLVTQLANPVPALLAMRLLGLPMTDWRAYADVAHKYFFTPPGSPEHAELVELHKWLGQQLRAAITARRSEPTDDLISFLIGLEVEGAPMGDDEILGCVQLLMFGGVDTTTNLLSNTLVHLHRNPEHRAWLLEDLSRLPAACEEFLRVYPPVQGLGRTATKGCVLDGQAVAQYERIWMGWAAANRDPEAFPEPEEVKLDRFPNRHASFGMGPHRCLGSNVARAMWEVIMTEVLTRLGNYEVDESRAQIYPSIGVMNGWVAVPATFEPGKRVGTSIELEP